MAHHNSTKYTRYTGRVGGGGLAPATYWRPAGSAPRRPPRSPRCTRLEAIVDAQEAVAREQDRDAFVELSMQFHRAFVEVGGNRLLLEFADRLRSRQAVMLHMTLTGADDPAASEVVADHRALLDACRRGDLGAFARLLHHHMSDKLAPRHGPV